MLSDRKHADLGRISIYDIETDKIQLSSEDLQLKEHTGYDDEHLKRLKYLFQQITGPQRTTLDTEHFESAVRSMCRSLTESREAHRLAEILFQAYDKNTNGSIDFPEMIDFVWTVVDAPREEQIVGLYQAFQNSHEKLSKERLIEFITILKEDFQPNASLAQKKIQGQMKSLHTDEDIQHRVDECLSYYHHPSDGLNLTQVIEYFLGRNDPLINQIRTRSNARKARHKKKNRK
ncbi:unnamed protein product [Adineta ricciae]|uniref:EF-hand domain-containing protein n=1 Tax=Adineta ricciae TaxID=249248 RepID=A0A816F988_ADIRI|nr:unnamed protein product [Adineta ricciae]CAF1657852.1 unnamed protein product [Adineta ricciae]